MIQSTFSFNDSGGCYFEGPSRWVRTSLPPQLEYLYTDKVIDLTYCVALGANGSFVCAYKKPSGADGLCLPPNLNDWISATTEDGYTKRKVPGMRISLGPGNHSYLGTDGDTWVWCNLPPAMEEIMQQRNAKGGLLDPPKVFSLGMDGDFVMITKSGKLISRLEHNGFVKVFLAACQMSNIGYDQFDVITLHPYRPNVGVIQTRMDFMVFGFPDSLEGHLATFKSAIENDIKAYNQKQKEEQQQKQQQQQAESLLERQMQMRRTQMEFDMRLQMQNAVYQFGTDCARSLNPNVTYQRRWH